MTRSTLTCAGLLAVTTMVAHAQERLRFDVAMRRSLCAGEGNRTGGARRRTLVSGTRTH